MSFAARPRQGGLRVVAGASNQLLGFVVQRLAPRTLVRRVAAGLHRPPAREHETAAER